ncbi:MULTISPECIES: helix-turn-helix transcriptional regulator [unclassified Yoonia]|uniref:helix-turn-helix domain-containing protein n=1 Tax=unclassified Yoonia TaxID=2629118 RepID=UPI002AFE2455|nr:MULTISPECIES: helix-turn-helix transcriptional regulator [unclassified Yoonia]
MTETDTDWYSAEAATFGDRLAGAREAAGLSQKDLAKSLGVKLSTLASWENDTGEPRANRLQMLAGMLGVSLGWLMTGQGDGLAAPDDAVEMPADVAALMQELRKLRAQMGQTLDRMGQVEKQLQTALRRVV